MLDIAQVLVLLAHADMDLVRFGPGLEVIIRDIQLQQHIAHLKGKLLQLSVIADLRDLGIEVGSHLLQIVLALIAAQGIGLAPDGNCRIILGRIGL